MDLYGLKYSALMLRNHLVDIIENKNELRYSLADLDVWYKVSMYETGFEYYTYILVYVDDILILDKTLKKYMYMLEESYILK